jgi:hypothetical protein
MRNPFRILWVRDEPPSFTELATAPDPEPEPYIPKITPGMSDQDNHEHALVAIATQQGIRQPLQPATTVVLFGCKICSFVREETYIGTWTLEQVTALHRQEGAGDAAQGS